MVELCVIQFCECSELTTKRVVRKKKTAVTLIAGREGKTAPLKEFSSTCSWVLQCEGPPWRGGFLSQPIACAGWGLT